jgi:hypothetical protein
MEYTANLDKRHIYYTPPASTITIPPTTSFNLVAIYVVALLAMVCRGISTMHRLMYYQASFGGKSVVSIMMSPSNKLEV